MARTIAQIQAAIITDIQADPILTPVDLTQPGLRSTSKRAIWRLLTNIFATATSLLENIIDIFKSDVETTASQAAAASPGWLAAKAFEFQYDATVPQVIQLVNTVPVYPVVDASKRITTRVSVSTDLSNNSLIKLAKQEPPVGFAVDELAAAQSYFNTIGGGGITYLCSSANADQLYIDATIYFDGQYRSVILANVTAAVTTFLQQLSSQANFGGKVYMSALEDAIRNAAGVIDVVTNNVKARADATAFVDGTFLIMDTGIIARYWPTIAGYIIPETTAGQTLAESLTLVAQ